jgi:hypothetical protein
VPPVATSVPDPAAAVGEATGDVADALDGN